MEYVNIVEGTFLSRPNRFVAHVLIDGKEEVCHVKNTGRLKELLLPGVTVYLEHLPKENRKTAYDLIAVKVGEDVINIDSQMPNRAVGEFLPKLFPDLIHLAAEKKYGASRFDFYAETPDKKMYIEVKGVTLREGKIALFPDAPTVRGVRHLKELETARTDGFEAVVIFLIAMDGVDTFSPNKKRHPEFADALTSAQKAGVKIYAFTSKVTPSSVTVDKEIKVVL